MDTAPPRPEQPASFGTLLRRYRLAAGLSQEALAERAGLSVQGLGALENGRRQAPYRHTVGLLAEALGLDAAQRAALEGAVVRRRGPPPAVPQTPPPPATARPVPHNLPAPTTALIGREHEVAGAVALLRRPEVRLLTLTGAGGVGKTRLAIEVARALLEDADVCAEGAWLVELAALADPALVVQTVASTLGLRETPGLPLLDSLCAHLADKGLLLVLDNCEHLIEACAALAAALLRSCPGLRLLATSREGLALPEETLRRVPSLAFPDPRHLPPVAEVGAYPAVALFLQRAQARREDVALSAHNAPAVAQVCARLDGIPLALELAAARLSALPVDEVAARLDDCFRLLSGGARTAVPRQRTLRATLDWSYELLSGPERILFVRLGVFAGSFTLDAVEAVCAGGAVPPDDVLDMFLRLVDKSLVVAEELPPAAGTAGEVRYRLLETIRQYAAEQRQACGEDAAVRARHAAYYRALAQQAAPHLRRQDQLVWFARLEADLDNLRAALRWSLEQGAAREGLRLCMAMGDLWALRGRITEGRAWLVELLALPAAHAASVERARALGWAGLWAFTQGETVAARRHLEEALALGRQLDDRVAVAWALLWLRWPTDPRERRYLEESLTVYRELGDESGITEALLELGDVALAQGDLPLARTYVEEALAVSRRTGERRHLAMVRQQLGRLRCATGDLADARRLGEECLLLFQEVGDLTGVAAQENGLGTVALKQGEYDAARAYYTASLQHQQGWQGVPWIVESVAGLAAVALAQGQVARALCLAGATAALSVQAGYRLDTPLQTGDRLDTQIERTVAAARAALDERAAAAAWATGEAMTLEQAMAYAVDGRDEA